jgi:hypothetical protein
MSRKEKETVHKKNAKKYSVGVDHQSLKPK